MLAKEYLISQRAKRTSLSTERRFSPPSSPRCPKTLCMSIKGSSQSTLKATSLAWSFPTASQRRLTPSLAPMASLDRCASTFSKRTLLSTRPRRLDSGTADIWCRSKRLNRNLAPSILASTGSMAGAETAASSCTTSWIMERRCSVSFPQSRKTSQRTGAGR